MQNNLMMNICQLSQHKKVAFIMIIVHSSCQMDLATFIDASRRWLDMHAEPLMTSNNAVEWGAGDDAVEVFHDLTDDDERMLLRRAMAWQRDKYDAGFGALGWPVELGGAGLGEEFRVAFEELEAGYIHPPHHETFSVTLNLVAPTIARFGQNGLRNLLLRRLLRTEVLSCQLFSEPGAGSDLAH